jgi:hypothetical protein
MTGRLQGKTALITAAGQGIGHATAMAMAREGAEVFATDVNPQLLGKFSGVHHVSARVLDVLDDAAIAKLAGELPPLDILFNCAGYVHHGTILDCAPKDWEFSFNLNVRAMYVTIRARCRRCWRSSGVRSGIVDHQHSLGRLLVKGLPNRFVARVEGRSDRPDEGDRRRLRDEGHSLQRNRPRNSRHTVTCRPDQRVPGPGRSAEDVRRAPADGAARQGRGDRAARGIPRL